MNCASWSVFRKFLREQGQTMADEREIAWASWDEGYRLDPVIERVAGHNEKIPPFSFVEAWWP